jgi:hypothetical protein
MIFIKRIPGPVIGMKRVLCDALELRYNFEQISALLLRRLAFCPKAFKSLSTFLEAPGNLRSYLQSN